MVQKWPRYNGINSATQTSAPISPVGRKRWKTDRRSKDYTILVKTAQSAQPESKTKISPFPFSTGLRARPVEPRFYPIMSIFFSFSRHSTNFRTFA